MLIDESLRRGAEPFGFLFKQDVVDAQIEVTLAKCVDLLLDLKDKRQQAGFDIARSDVHAVDIGKHALEISFARWRSDRLVCSLDLSRSP